MQKISSAMNFATIRQEPTSPPSRDEFRISAHENRVASQKLQDNKSNDLDRDEQSLNRVVNRDKLGDMSRPREMRDEAPFQNMVETHTNSEIDNSNPQQAHEPKDVLPYQGSDQLNNPFGGLLNGPDVSKNIETPPVMEVINTDKMSLAVEPNTQLVGEIIPTMLEAKPQTPLQGGVVETSSNMANQLLQTGMTQPSGPQMSAAQQLAHAQSMEKAIPQNPTFKEQGNTPPKPSGLAEQKNLETTATSQPIPIKQETPVTERLPVWSSMGEKYSTGPRPSADKSNPGTFTPAGNSGASTPTSSNSSPAIQAQGDSFTPTQSTPQNNSQSAPLQAQPAMTPVSTGSESLQTQTNEIGLGASRNQASQTLERATNTAQRFTPASATKLAAQITRNFNAGSKIFQIRLDPAELGRVDIKLELLPDQRVQAILSVEKTETLAELQRSARDLERALNDAGLELSGNGLEFELKQESDHTPLDDENDANALNVYAEIDEIDLNLNQAGRASPKSVYGFMMSHRDSIDVRA